MKKLVNFKIIMTVIFIFIIAVSQGQAYESNNISGQTYEAAEENTSGFVQDHLKSFIQSPLDSDFNNRFKDLFITKDISQFKSLPAINIHYNTMLLNPHDFYYDSPIYSGSKNCFNFIGTSF